MNVGEELLTGEMTQTATSPRLEKLGTWSALPSLQAAQKVRELSFQVPHLV